MSTEAEIKSLICDLMPHELTSSLKTAIVDDFWAQTSGSFSVHKATLLSLLPGGDLSTKLKLICYCTNCIYNSCQRPT